MERLEKGRFLCWRFGACILLAATISAAASPPVGSVLQPKEVQARLAQWQEQYHAVLVDLRAHDPRLTKRARRHASELYQDIVDRAISGEALCQSAGRVLVLLAIAEVRLGDRDDGVWHWQMAQNVSSDLRSQDFAEFTDIAFLMKESLIPEDRWNGLRRNAKGEIQIGEKDHPPEVVPPKLKKRVAPRYPAGLEAQRVAEATVVDGSHQTTRFSVLRGA